MSSERSMHNIQTLLESTSEGIYGIDNEGLCTFANRATSEMTGWSVEELLGKQMHELLHHHRSDGSIYSQTDCPIYAAFREERGCRVHGEVFWRRDGTSFHVAYGSNPTRENGVVTGAVVTFMDVSERIHAETALRESEARKSAIMASALDAILTIDRTGLLVDFNPAAERMFGFRREEVVGREMAELIIPPALREKHRRGLAHCVATGEGPILDQRIEISALHADGTEFPIELTVTTIPGSDHGAFTGFIRDITDRKMVETTLRESRAEQRLITEAIPQQVWTAQPDGTLDYVNNRVVEYFGRTREEVVGSGWLDVLHPEDVPATVERWTNALTTGQPYEVEFRLRRTDGEYRWHLGRALPLHDAGGAIARWFGTNTDITERKRAEEEREIAAQRSKLLAEASALLGSSLDYETTLNNVVRLVVPEIADWCIIDLLDAAGQIRGVAHAHSEQSKIELVKEMNRRYPPQRNDPVGVASVLRTGKPEIFPAIDDDLLRAAAKDDEHYEFLKSLRLRSAIVVPLQTGGKTVGALTLVRESESALTEEDLPFAQDLATRTALAVENSRLYSEAQRANAAKDRFFAVLSHELRTPLNPVLMTVSAMESDPSLPAVVRADIAMIRRNVELEARLIDDLLDLTRISNNKLTLNRQVVDTHELLDYALHIVRSDSSLSQAPLRMELGATDIHTEGDPARLQQIFWNLLKNAVKFTPPTGVVMARTSNPGPGQLLVEVIDTGRGIEPALLPVIFDAFQQEHLDDRPAPAGLGLGLAISKALAELHGGQLTVASAGRDQGATFSLSLTTVSPAPAAPRLTPAPETPAAILRILVVEDHETTAAAMVRLLSRRGHAVRIAHSVKAALEIAAQNSFDVVLSDLGLPDGNGFELMEELRDLHGLRGIALSGYGMELDQDRSLRSGFIAHLTKPVDLQRLLRALAEITPAEAP
ncbi:MAG: PAS domain S-box protein [Chthoniobacterales bacterium]